MKKNKIYDLIFITPGLLIYILFMVIPILMCFFYSITNWNGLNPTFKIVGLKNFANIFSDSSYIDALKNTLIFTVITTVIYNIMGIIIAVIINKVGKAYSFSKALFFLPVVLSGVVVAFIWSYMAQTSGGIINYILKALYLQPFDFFASKLRMVTVVALATSWGGLGMFIIIYIASLNTIPEEVIEASKIDGAGSVTRFFKIILPLMIPGITINSLLALIGGFKQYDQMKVMVPGFIQSATGNAVEKAFSYNMLGYSSALILVLFIIILIITILELKIMKRFEVEY